MFLFLPLILVAIFFECTITSLPLLLIILTVIVILRKDIWLSVFAFLGGLLIDVSAVRTMGISSIFLICWVFLILLYERKYEINKYPFVVISIFTGSLLYLFIKNSYSPVLQAVVSGVIGGIAFALLSLLNFRQKKENQLVL